MVFDVDAALRMLRQELERINAAIAAMEKLLQTRGRNSPDRHGKHGSAGRRAG